MTIAAVWEKISEGPVECLVCKAVDIRPMLAAVDTERKVVLGYFHKHHRKATLSRAGITHVLKPKAGSNQ